jgi:hypothetical protein
MMYYYGPCHVGGTVLQGRITPHDNYQYQQVPFHVIGRYQAE